MWYDDLFKELENLYDKDMAIKMEEYMQNEFKFLGIPKPKLNAFIKPYLKESKKYKFDLNFIYQCWDKEYREAQYIGISYLLQNIKYLRSDNIDDIKYLITHKSWWEVVDSLDYVVGKLVSIDKSLYSLMEEWSMSDNIWLRRVSIDFQQAYKDNTNTILLEKIIANNLNSNEFFINKAIGWSLREYSKVNPIWVKEFINKYKNKMNKLSIKEASKYI